MASRSDTGRTVAYAALLALGALDATGYGIIAPVVPEISERTGAGPGVVGALVTCFGLGQIAGYPLAGVLQRRWNASAVIAAALALVAAGDLMFALGDGLAVWFPARTLMGVGAGGLWLGAVFGIMERFPGDEYRRLSLLLGVYSVGGVAGPGIGAAGGVRGPFLVHLGLVVAAGLALVLVGAPQSRPRLESDRSALRAPGFALASAGVLLIALASGTLEGPLPLHFSERLGQAGIAVFFVSASVAVGAVAVAASTLAPRQALALSIALVPAGVALAGATGTLPAWIAAVAITAVGFGAGETGSLGALLESVGAARIVLAMVVWSQVWGLGYLAGPGLSGLVAEHLGFTWIGLVPAAGAVATVLAWPRGSRCRASAFRRRRKARG